MITPEEITKFEGSTPSTRPESPSSPIGPESEYMKSLNASTAATTVAGDAMTPESATELEELCKKLWSGYTGEAIDIDLSCLTEVKPETPTTTYKVSGEDFAKPNASTAKTIPSASFGRQQSPSSGTKSLRFEDSSVSARTPPRARVGHEDDALDTQKPEQGGGLSELSKQLRQQRAKNDFQQSEIERLERQVRILSDLKGVSVGDLRTTLETACAEEAHEELRNQVLSLEAQLEALRAKNDSNRRRASVATSEAANQKIATLQLRIGELEEVEEGKRAEMRKLYSRLQDQTSKATILDSTCKQQKAQLDKFQEVANEYIQDMQKLKKERDTLRENNFNLNRNLKEMEGNIKVEQDMRDIERQIQQEQANKARYIQEAREAKGVSAASGSQQRPVTKRLSGNQLAAIQQAVGMAAGIKSGQGSTTGAVRTSRNVASPGQEGAQRPRNGTAMNSGKRSSVSRNLSADQLAAIQRTITQAAGKKGVGSSNRGKNQEEGSAARNLSPDQLAAIQRAIGQAAGKQGNGSTTNESDSTGFLGESSKTLSESQLAAIQHAISQAAAKQGGKALTENQLTSIVESLKAEQMRQMRGGTIAQGAETDEATKALTEKQLASIVEALKVEQRRRVAGGSSEGTPEHASNLAAIIEGSSKSLTNDQLNSIVQALKAEQERLMKGGTATEGSLDDPENERLASIARTVSPAQFAALQKVLENQLAERRQRKAGDEDALLARSVVPSQIQGNTRAQGMETDEATKALTKKQLASIVEALKAEQRRRVTGGSSEATPEDASNLAAIVEGSSKNLTDDQLNSIVQALKAEQERLMKGGTATGSLDDPENESLASITRTLSPEQFTTLQKVLENQLAERRQRKAGGEDALFSRSVELSGPASQANDFKIDEVKAKDIKIDRLYNELRHQAAKATQLEAVVAEQKSELERAMQETKKEAEAMKHVKTNYDWAVSEHDNLYKKFCDLELELTLEKDKAKSYLHQLTAREKEYNLRNDQFDCRFQVQNERIVDLEQQQSSLYAAFEMLREEVSAQDKEHSELKSSLDHADSEVARQLDGEQKRQSTSQNVAPSSTESEPQMVRGLMRDGSVSVPSFLGSPDNIFDQQPTVSGNVVTKGFLWKLDKIKGWKRRYFTLYGQRGVYHLSYGDGPREKVKGIYEYITTGVSSVSETNKSIKKPFSFVLNPDPTDSNAVVLNAAATNSEDFEAWMAALRKVTLSPDESLHFSTPEFSVEAQEQAEADHAIALRLQRECASLV